MPDRDADALANRFTSYMTASERAEYDRWLNTSSISTPHSDEMVIAFRLAKLVGVEKTKVIRALRGQRGQDRSLISRLERIVAANPSIHFVQDGRVRRVAFVPVARRQ